MISRLKSGFKHEERNFLSEDQTLPAMVSGVGAEVMGAKGGSSLSGAWRHLFQVVSTRSCFA
jgi:hypothetical protein